MGNDINIVLTGEVLKKIRKKEKEKHKANIHHTLLLI